MGGRGQRAWCAFAVALVFVGGASSAAGPRLSLVRGPTEAEVGAGVTFVVAATRGGRPLTKTKVAVWIRNGSASRTFPARAAAKGRYSARVFFPSAGRWIVGARAGGTSRALRTVDVKFVLHVREPFRVVLAPDGSLLVADGFANRILRVDPANGATTSFAGNGSRVGPAPAGDARTAAIGRPLDVTIAPDGDVVFVSDEKVWRIDATSFALTHVAGTVDGHAGDGGPATQAQLKGPTAVDVDGNGNIFVAEYGGYVRRIDAATGVITTVAGIGAEASSGDGGPATAAAIDRPHGVAVAADGSVYVPDSYGDRLRRFTVGGTMTTAARGFATPTGVVVAGDVVYVAEASAVTRVALSGTTTRVASVLGPTGVAVLPDGRLVASLVGEPLAGTGKLVQIDPSTGAVRDLTR